MAKKRCIQCDKPLPESWSTAKDQNLEAICPGCALRNMRKKSIRRRRILDTSVRTKPTLKQSTAIRRKQPSTRTDIPFEIELDTEDPMLLSAEGQADQEEQPADAAEELSPEEKEKFDGEQTTQIRRPKNPPSTGTQIKLDF